MKNREQWGSRLGFILAASGSSEKTQLGSHEAAGYRQRQRFYEGVSAEGRLLFAKGIARYIIFLARTTGMVSKAKCDEVLSLLESYSTYKQLLNDIAPNLS